MKISLKALHRRQPVPRLVIHSLDQALYTLTAELDGQSFLVTETDDRLLRRHSLTAMREALEVLAVDELVLRQESAYDEMVGQPRREASNAMEILLGKSLYPELTRH